MAETMHALVRYRPELDRPEKVLVAEPVQDEALVRVERARDSAGDRKYYRGAARFLHGFSRVTPPMVYSADALGARFPCSCRRHMHPSSHRAASQSPPEEHEENPYA